MSILIGILLTYIGFRVTLNYLNGVYNCAHAVPIVWIGAFAMGAGTWLVISEILN